MILWSGPAAHSHRRNSSKRKKSVGQSPAFNLFGVVEVYVFPCLKLSYLLNSTSELPSGVFLDAPPVVMIEAHEARRIHHDVPQRPKTTWSERPKTDFRAVCWFHADFLLDPQSSFEIECWSFSQCQTFSGTPPQRSIFADATP